MTYAIIFNSLTGNTKILADHIAKSLPKEDCLYFGKPDLEALKADIIYLGFWTIKGQCDVPTEKFLSNLENKKVFLFGTCGYGQDVQYFNQIISNTKALLPDSTKVIGSFMCQGKMGPQVRKRYEDLLGDPKQHDKMLHLIENFDQALSHPNQNDLDELSAKIKF